VRGEGHGTRHSDEETTQERQQLVDLRDAAYTELVGAPANDAGGERQVCGAVADGGVQRRT
jgi:hypothetical protein